jgi:hypothetical protein
LERAGQAGNGKRLGESRKAGKGERLENNQERLAKGRGWKIIRRGWQREEARRELEGWQTGEAGK